MRRVKGRSFDPHPRRVLLVPHSDPSVVLVPPRGVAAGEHAGAAVDDPRAPRSAGSVTTTLPADIFGGALLRDWSGPVEYCETGDAWLVHYARTKHRRGQVPRAEETQSQPKETT